jgi:hypothetical protein
MLKANPQPPCESGTIWSISRCLASPQCAQRSRCRLLIADHSAPDMEPTLAFLRTRRFSSWVASLSRLAFDQRIWLRRLRSGFSISQRCVRAREMSRCSAFHLLDRSAQAVQAVREGAAMAPQAQRPAWRRSVYLRLLRRRLRIRLASRQTAQWTNPSARGLEHLLHFSGFTELFIKPYCANRVAPITTRSVFTRIAP